MWNGTNNGVRRGVICFRALMLLRISHAPHSLHALFLPSRSSAKYKNDK